MAERNCDHCGTRYSRSPSLLGRYCSAACGHAARRKVETTHRRMRVAPDHPLAPESGLLPEARAGLYDRIGPGPHPCHWCGKEVDWVVGLSGNHSHAIVADHLDSDYLNDDPANVVVACGDCNRYRGTKVPDDDDYVVRPNGTRLRVGQARICDTCGDTFLTTRSERRRCQRCRRNPRWLRPPARG